MWLSGPPPPRSSGCAGVGRKNGDTAGPSHTMADCPILPSGGGGWEGVRVGRIGRFRGKDCHETSCVSTYIHQESLFGYANACICKCAYWVYVLCVCVCVCVCV